jgi:hypothetical protein
MSKITVLCRFPGGLTLHGPSPVRFAFDDVTGEHRRESTHLFLRHGVNEDVDAEELQAWVRRAANHGLKFERLLDAYVVSDGLPKSDADMQAFQRAAMLERALACDSVVAAR